METARDRRTRRAIWAACKNRGNVAKYHAIGALVDAITWQSQEDLVLLHEVFDLDALLRADRLAYKPVLADMDAGRKQWLAE